MIIRDTLGALLAKREIADFTNGRYLTWQLQGKVCVTIRLISCTPATPPNAMMSGLFLDLAK